MTIPISLDGVQWPVPTNLASALRHLRHPTEERVFWIDAICIDQNNFGERAAQIKLMGNIYSSAQAVRMWLGEAADQSDDSMEVLRQIFDGIPFHKLRLRNRTITSEELLPLGKIFERPLWHRVWVVQEFVLARKAIMVCGIREISLGAGFRASFQESFLRSSTAYTLPGGLLGAVWSHYREFLDGFRKSLAPLGDIRDLYLMSCSDDSEKLLNFAVILATCQQFEASKDHDKFYGALGLSPPSLREHIVPNYESSLSNLYQEFILAITQHLSSLTLFDRFRVETSRHPIVPTWASVWTSNARLFRVVQHYRLPRSVDYNACASHGLSLCRVDARTVRLRGMFIDRVSLAGPVFPDQHLADCSQQFQDLERFCPASSARFQDMRYISGGTVKNAFWRTMMNDKIWRDSGPLQRCQEDDEQEFYRLWYLIRTNVKSISEVEGMNGNLLAWHMRYRRAIYTERGYLGLAPRDSKPGDSIYILAGGSEPFVLRPSESAMRPRTFTLVGASYIHGIMDGEALSESSKTQNIKRTDWQRLKRFGGHLPDRRIPLKNFVDIYLE